MVTSGQGLGRGIDWKFGINMHTLVQLLSHALLFATLGLLHPRLSYPSSSPRACSNSCLLSLWYHPTILSSAIPFSSCLQSFPASGFFPNELALCIRWPKYWSFSFSICPSNEYSGLISFRIDWFDLLAAQRTLKSLLQLQFQNHQFFRAQPSLESNLHIHTWLLGKP